MELVKDIFPNAIHQLCILHFLRLLRMTVPKGKKNNFYLINEMFYDDISKIFSAPDKLTADKYFKELLMKKDFYNQKYHKTILRLLTQSYNLLTNYLLYPFIPPNTNPAENVNKQSEMRLKITDTFKSYKTLKNLLKLWFIYFQFEPQINFKKRGHVTSPTFDIA